DLRHDLVFIEHAGILVGISIVLRQESFGAYFLSVFFENVFNAGLFLRLHFLRNIVAHLIRPEIDKRQMPYSVNAGEQTNRRNGPHHDRAHAMGQDVLVSAPVPEQMEHEDHQDDVLDKRFPWGKFYRVAKASTIRHFVEVRRVERQEGKEDHERQQHHSRIFHFVSYQKGHADDQFQNDQKHSYLQGKGNEEMKESAEVGSKDLEVFFQFDLGSDRIIQFDEPGENKETAYKVY